MIGFEFSNTSERSLKIGSHFGFARMGVSRPFYDILMVLKISEKGINFNHADAGFQAFPLERHGRWVHSRNFCNGEAVSLSRT